MKEKRPKTFYYYKRWLWMNFPIICLSNEKYSFSEIITICYSESQSLLNFEQDKNLYLKSLSIVHTCKKNKKKILKNKFKKSSVFLTKTSLIPAVDFIIGKKKNIKSFYRKASLQNHKIKGNGKTMGIRLRIMRKSTFGGKLVGHKGHKKGSKTVDFRKQVIKKNFNSKKSIKDCFMPLAKFTKDKKKKQSKILRIKVNLKNNTSALSKILKKSKFIENCVLRKNIIDL